MDFQGYKEIVLTELDTVLSAVDGRGVNELADAVMAARRVFVVGVGRVQLSLLAFVKRLNHLGIDATYVGAIDEPAIGTEDLLIVGSGSGETAIPVAIAKMAKNIGVKIVHVGSNTNSSVSDISDIIVRIPCRTKLNLNDEIDSRQPMSSLFEQSLLIFCDILAMMIIDKKNLNWKDLWHTHANLE